MKLKILFVTNQFNPPRSTGSGNSSSLIYKELKDRSHDVDLLIFDDKSYEKDYKDTKYEKFYRKNTKLNIIKELSKINDGEYDIIHKYGGGFSRSILPIVGRNFKKTKLVVTFNGPYIACWNYLNYDKDDNSCCNFPKNFRCAMEKRKITFKWLSFFEYFIRKIQRVANRKYDNYFVQSKPMKALFSEANFDKLKTKLIPNFFDPTFYEKLKDFKSENGDKLVVLYLGGLKQNKGVSNLIKAFKKIKKNNIELRIVGNGSQKENLMKIAKDDERIKFLGFLEYKSDEFTKQYLESDIFVHPGIWPEPFNRTILEAPLAHNAMIVSDIGAPPDVLKDKALIYDPHNVQELADCLRELIDKPEKRNKMANEVHDYILEKYSLESAIDKLEREYEKLSN